VTVDGKPVSLHELFCQHTVYYIPSQHWTSLAYTLMFTAFCWCATWLLYRKRIFLKI